VLFDAVRGAKACVEKLNGTSVMGQVLEVLLDPFGNICKEKFEECTTDKKKESIPPIVKEANQPDVPPETSFGRSKSFSDDMAPHKLSHRVGHPE